MERKKRITVKYFQTKKLILSYLAQENKPVTADELYINMRTQRERISMTTVYKYLDLLTDSGDILENTDAKARAYRLLALG